MHRIDNPSAATSLPTPKPPGPGGFFTAGNINVGQNPTIVEYDFLNTIQEELMSIVSKGGLTADKNNNTQVLQALGTMLTGSFTQATATQNILVPAWATRIEFQLASGGGGGAHCQSDGTNHRSGGGGGSGAYLDAIRPVIAGDLIAYTHGQGGPSDTDGGTASLVFGANWTCTCTGGKASIYDAPNNSPGGAGGVPTGGDLMAHGTYGGDGMNAGVYATTGYGAPGPWGGGGRSGAGGGAPGLGPGSGGGGAYDPTASGVHYAGGAGADGVLKYRFLP